MDRRGFLKGLGGIFLAGAAPAIVRADSLMRIVPRELEVLTPFSQEIVIDQMRGPPPLFVGEIGRYEGVRIILTDVSAARVSGSSLDREAAPPDSLTLQLLRAARESMR